MRLASEESSIDKALEDSEFMARLFSDSRFLAQALSDQVFVEEFIRHGRIWGKDRVKRRIHSSPLPKWRFDIQIVRRRPICRKKWSGRGASAIRLGLTRIFFLKCCEDKSLLNNLIDDGRLWDIFFAHKRFSKKIMKDDRFWESFYSDENYLKKAASDNRFWDLFFSVDVFFKKCVGNEKFLGVFLFRRKYSWESGRIRGVLGPVFFKRNVSQKVRFR